MDLRSDSRPGMAAGRGFLIETKSLCYTLPAGRNAPRRSILKDVTCKARPGELLAIVGPSGAGKSTLLSFLAGGNRPAGTVSGSILVNSRPMHTPSFRRASGHVAQDDDALFPMLTVEESLSYSACLRLGGQLRDAAVRARALLAELGLADLSASPVHTISGGERRRVSIGSELVHDPPVLLLDEPTSGLDSASAAAIIATLKSMASRGEKTVVMTIHQPGFRILDLLDGVAIISDGVLRFQGPVSVLERRLRDEGHTIPPHVNVLEYAVDAMGSMIAVITCAAAVVPADSLVSGDSDDFFCNCHHANSRIKEVMVLLERCTKNMVRTRQFLVARMIQASAAGLGLGTIFMNVGNQQAKVGLFAFSLTFLLSSSMEGLPIYLQERRILMRETSHGAYRLSSYVMANSLVFLPLLATAALLFASPVYWLVGLRREIDSFAFFSVVVWLVMLMVNALVACFGALVPNFIMGNSLITGLIGCFFLFSGYFISKQSIPKYWIFMHYLSLFKYPFESFLLNEFGGENGRQECIQPGGSGGGCLLSAAMFLRQQGMEESHKWRNVGVMLGFICGYRFLSFIILWIRCLKLTR